MTFDNFILFLDIDGVCTSDVETPGSYFSHDVDTYGISPSCIKILDSIISELDARVVISSTWRNFCSKDYYMYKGIKIPSPLPQLKKHLGKIIVGYLPDSGFQQKVVALKQFLKENTLKAGFAILDDDLKENFQNEDEYGISSCFCKIDPKYGLTMKDKNKVKCVAKKIDIKKVFEDAMVAGGDAGGGDGVAPSAGIGANDVLGHCDHKSDGYLGGDPAGCFHIPSKCKVPFKRYEICNGGGKKKKKTFYDKGMQIITDAELSRDVLRQIADLDEEIILEQLARIYGTEGAMFISYDIEAVCYYPVTGDFFVKLVGKDRVPSLPLFLVVDFDTDKKQFIKSKSGLSKIMLAAQAKQEFKKILNMKGNSPMNKGSDDMKLWVVWGSL